MGCIVPSRSTTANANIVSVEVDLDLTDAHVPVVNAAASMAALSSPLNTRLTDKGGGTKDRDAVRPAVTIDIPTRQTKEKKVSKSRPAAIDVEHQSEKDDIDTKSTKRGQKKKALAASDTYDESEEVPSEPAPRRNEVAKEETFPEFEMSSEPRREGGNKKTLRSIVLATKAIGLVKPTKADPTKRQRGSTVTVTIGTGQKSLRNGAIPEGTKPVRLRILGVDGVKSPEMSLKENSDGNRDLFSPGSTDIFELRVPNEQGLAPLASLSLFTMRPQTLEAQHAYDFWFIESIKVAYKPYDSDEIAIFNLISKRWIDGGIEAVFFPGREITYRLEFATIRTVFSAPKKQLKMRAPSLLGPSLRRKNLSPASAATSQNLKSDPPTEERLKVSVNLIGEEGATGWRKLILTETTNAEPFLRPAMTDIFDIYTHRPIGKILSIKIHAEKACISWLLHNVRAHRYRKRHESDGIYFFFGNWLHMANQRNEIEIFPGEGHRYAVTLHTREIRKNIAGTFLSLQIHGENLSAEDILKFDPTQIEANLSLQDQSFYFEIEICHQFLEIDKINLVQKNCAKKWHLKSVEIKNIQFQISNSKNFIFELADDMPEGDETVTLAAVAVPHLYKIKIKNKDFVDFSSAEGGATGEAVSIELFGKKGESGEIFLKQKVGGGRNLLPGTEDIYIFQIKDLGEIKKARLSLSPPISEHVFWMPAAVEIEPPPETSQKKKYKFECNRWLNADFPAAEMTPVNGRHRQIQYLIKISIGRFLGTGPTVGSPYISLLGADKRTDKYLLHSRRAPSLQILPAGKNTEKNIEKKKILFPETREIFVVWSGSVGGVEGVEMGVVGDENLSVFLESISIICENVKRALPGTTDSEIENVGGGTSTPGGGTEMNTSCIEKEEYFFGAGVLISAADPTVILKSQNLCTYQVSVMTSEISPPKISDSTATFIKLFGAKNNSSIVRLKECVSGKGSIFSRGATNIFVVESPELGPILKCIIYFDNFRAPTDVWFLDKISVRKSSAPKNISTPHAPTVEETYVFACSRWLNSEICEIELLEGHGFSYLVSVQTGDIRGAGTDAEVYCEFAGDRGRSGVCALSVSNEKKMNKFERGQTDTFTIVAPFNLGEIKWIRVGQNGRFFLSDWFLESINLSEAKSVEEPADEKHEIEIEHGTREWNFPCHRWLSEGQLEVLLRPGPGATYFIAVETGDCVGASTDARVTLELFGERGRSEPFLLIGPISGNWKKFERGQTDIFEMTTNVDLGEIFEIQISLAPPTAKPWFLRGVTVTPPNGVEIVFPFEKVIEPSSESPAQLQPGQFVTYFVEIATKTRIETSLLSSLRGSVYLSVFGTGGASGRIPLSRNVYDAVPTFRNGEKESFKFTSPRDFGRILQVHLERESTSTDFRWLIASVTVSSPSVSQTFECDTWMEGVIGGVSLSEAGSVALERTEPLPSSGTLTGTLNLAKKLFDFVSK